jgi:hypothetical protein
MFKLGLALFLIGMCADGVRADNGHSVVDPGTPTHERIQEDSPSSPQIDCPVITEPQRVVDDVMFDIQKRKLSKTTSIRMPDPKSPDVLYIMDAAIKNMGLEWFRRAISKRSTGENLVGAKSIDNALQQISDYVKNKGTKHFKTWVISGAYMPGSISMGDSPTDILGSNEASTKKFVDGIKALGVSVDRILIVGNTGAKLLGTANLMKDLAWNIPGNPRVKSFDSYALFSPDGRVTVSRGNYIQVTRKADVPRGDVTSNGLIAMTSLSKCRPITR